MARETETETENGEGSVEFLRPVGPGFGFTDEGDCDEYCCGCTRHDPRTNRLPTHCCHPKDLCRCGGYRG